MASDADAFRGSAAYWIATSASCYTQQSALMCILPDVIRNVTTADCYTIVTSLGISGLCLLWTGKRFVFLNPW
jgi:hypothetical protein